MTTIKQKDPRFRNIEVKIGVLVATAVAGIVAVVIFIGMQKDLFTKKYTVSFISGSGSGFIEGMPVKLSGFKIGRVKSIELTSEARVKVVAELNRKYDRWVRVGSKARLSKEGFIGDPFVEVTVGDPAGRMLADGDDLPFEKSGGIEELVNEAKPILTEVKEIIHYVNDPEGDIKQTLANVREMTAEFKSTGKTADKVLKKTERMLDDIDRKAGPMLDSASSAVKNLDAASSRAVPLITRLDGIAARADLALDKLPGVMDNMEKTSVNVRRLTDTLVNESPRIRDLLMDAGDALRDGKAVIKGVKGSWPVRLMVPPVKKPGLVPLEGYVLEGSVNAGHQE